jgi:hypothetical protein
LPLAETEASSSPAGPLTTPNRRRQPVPRPTDVNANIREILIDGAAGGAYITNIKPAQRTFGFGDHALCQAYCKAQYCTVANSALGMRETD